MAEGKTPTPATVSLPGFHAGSVPYDPVHDFVVFPAGDHAATNLNTEDPPQYTHTNSVTYPYVEDGSGIQPSATPNDIFSQNFSRICIVCLATALGHKPCPHGLSLHETPEYPDRTGGGGPDSVGPTGQSLALKSGFIEPYRAPYFWKYGCGPSAAQWTTHYAAASAASVASIYPVYSVGSTNGCASAVGTTRVGHHNVQAEETITGYQPPVSATHVADRPHLSSRFPESTASIPASTQVQVASQSAAQREPLMGQEAAPPVNATYIAHIARFNAAIKTWYVVITGWRVGVFASEPFHVLSAKRRSRKSYYCYDNYDEALAQFRAAEERGEVEECD